VIFSRAAAIAGAVFGGLAVFLIMQAVNALWVIPAARDAGREIERAATLKRSMDIIEQRSRTNAEIRSLDDRGLCAALGGVLEDGECR
jgi:hypothetical protein